MSAAYREIESKIIDQLIQRIGDDRFDLWFEGKNSLRFNGDSLTVHSVEYFAQNRIKTSFADDLRQASLAAVGRQIEIDFKLAAHQTLLKRSGVRSSEQASEKSIPGGLAIHSNTSENRQPEQHESVAAAKTASIAPDFPSAGANRVSSQNRQLAAAARAKIQSEDSQGLGGFSFGSTNGLLKSAVTEIVNRPGSFSPLYFYGPVGCGKTHLLQGIIAEYRNRRRISRCIYMTAEQFTSNFIEAIDGRGVSDFRRKCRGLEALAIDDIQFFGGKRATLIEFQSTIEALVREGKQILLAGDCSLAELRNFDSELINRIAGGLPCSVNYADKKARKTILTKLANKRDLKLDNQVLDYLAGQLGKDVRHLSGALNRIQAAQMSGLSNISVEQTHQLILDLIQAARSNVTIREIESAVGDFCGVPPRELRSNSRNKHVSTARMLAMYLSRRLTGCAFAEIGQHFGGRSHSTVISANNKIKTWMDRNHFISVNYTECAVGEVVDRIESKLQIG